MNKIIEIQLEYENRCFLNCLHCSSNSIKNEGKRGYSLNDVTSLIDEFDEEVYLYLTGGEPLSNNSLISDLNHLNKNRKIHLGLFSSGVFVNNGSISGISSDFAEQLKNAGLSKVYLSLYHTENAKHQSITLQNESFIAFQQTLKNLLNADIEVGIHFVLMSINMHDIDDILTKCFEMGVQEVRFLRLIKHGNAIDNWAQIGIDYNIQDSIIKKFILRNIDYNYKLTFSGYPELTPCRTLKDSIGCQAGIKLLYITFNGIVYPCACTKELNEYKISNIMEIERIKKSISSKNVGYYSNCLNPPLITP